MATKERILIAGIGNIFLGDDGFGVDVAKRLESARLPDWVRVADFGIRGIHLAYELLDNRYETLILVDATPRGGAPGTVYLIEPDFSAKSATGFHDAHSMHPEAVLETARSLGASFGKIYIVGCEPVEVEEGIGLSAPASQAVEVAVELILDIVRRQTPGESPIGVRKTHA